MLIIETYSIKSINAYRAFHFFHKSVNHIHRRKSVHTSKPGQVVSAYVRQGYSLCYIVLV